MTQNSFNNSYQQLNAIAQKLRNQSEPDIDALVPMVEEATKAYQVCKQRIEDVKVALKEHFKDQQPL
ncbi:MAG TPA: exodeoxyribonuclease VII small subunit [Gammaproteobacteria bacterium]|nr:exodeoxyribonuclease VII small subunit [Gammaproteobacteria bacterium]